MKLLCDNSLHIPCDKNK